MEANEATNKEASIPEIITVVVVGFAVVFSLGWIVRDVYSSIREDAANKACHQQWNANNKGQLEEDISSSVMGLGSEDSGLVDGVTRMWLTKTNQHVNALTQLVACLENN